MEIPKRWLSEHGPSPSHDREDLASGLLMLICGDVIRPALPWMLTRSHRYLASVMAETRDPHGFARLRQLAAAGPASARQDAQTAATRIAILLACKGGRINDITVGDCVELIDTQRRVHARGGQKKVDFYLRLRAMGYGHLPRGRPGHDPRLRARPGPVEHRRAGGPLCANASRRWTSPAWTRSPVRSRACSGPASKIWHQESTLCDCPRRWLAPGKTT
ncbi:hypothetical protein PYK79_48090 [Streptomyces sp. ID05-04B]|uniref:hypothetical protein n=1 Tax=Streptomyces sp. ID05-04B TaxID=3028661 RepID=UPI0029C19DB2|nr:hypothetical protein [Streptomyces sp. ID05-04B]MDX5569468.1 hypothetical protein [Streptomyces sp. ID05-04B]